MTIRCRATVAFPSILLLCAGTALSACLGGCGTPSRTAGPPEVVAGPGPADQEWMDKHARFAAAIEGLRFDDGIVEIEQPLEGDTVRAADLVREGVEHYDHSRYIEAVRAHAHAVRMASQFTEGYFRLGESLLAHGRVEYSIAAHRTAVQIDPAFTDARFALAMVLWMEQETAGAIEHMTEVVNQQPDHPAAHERLAIWHYYTGDLATAWQHVHAARSLEHAMPPQFIPLLEARMADPQR